MEDELVGAIKTLLVIVKQQTALIENLARNHFSLVDGLRAQFGLAEQSPETAADLQARERTKTEIEKLEKMFGQRASLEEESEP